MTIDFDTNLTSKKYNYNMKEILENKLKDINEYQINLLRDYPNTSYIIQQIELLIEHHKGHDELIKNWLNSNNYVFEIINDYIKSYK